MPQPRTAAPGRRGREGSRWYNERPSAADFAKWFKTVPLHADLSHESYVSGVVLIPSKEKTKEVRGFNEATGAPVIVDTENLVYSPHPNVSTRVRYWQDYLAVADLDGAVVADPPPGVQTHGLPEGFFKYVAPDNTGKPVTYVGCSLRVRMFKPGTMRYADVLSGPKGERIIRRVVEGHPVFEGAAGAKIVPVTHRWGADENAIMKAQTGALGRALGMAGMLVIPGAGIATSEDMHEALSGENAGVATPELPTPAGPRLAVVPSIDDLVSDLRKLSPQAADGFEAWFEQRGMDRDRPGDVNTAIKRLERDIDRLTREGA